MGINKITFNKGEKREVTATITSKNPKETVVVASAEFELRKTSDCSIVQKGSCEVTGNEVVVFLDLAKKGDYKLKIISSVGREVVISKALVVVE